MICTSCKSLWHSEFYLLIYTYKIRFWRVIFPCIQWKNVDKVDVFMRITGGGWSECFHEAVMVSTFLCHFQDVTTKFQTISKATAGKHQSPNVVQAIMHIKAVIILSYISIKLISNPLYNISEEEWCLIWPFKVLNRQLAGNS